MRIFCLLLLLATFVRAQEFTEEGWFRAEDVGEEGSPGTPPAPSEEGVHVGKSRTGEASPGAIAEAITPEIAALARGLENDPVQIFNYCPNCQFMRPA